MASRARRVTARTEYWPSFVDVLTNLLLVFVFLLSIFALVQFILSREISGRDTVLQRLNAQSERDHLPALTLDALGKDRWPYRDPKKLDHLREGLRRVGVPAW